MLSLLVAKQAWKDDFSYGVIRQYPPVCFCLGSLLSVHFFLVFKLRVKRILVHFYFQLFRLYICTVNVTPAYVGRNPEIFHNTLQTLMGECSCERTAFQPLVGQYEFHIEPLSKHVQHFIQRSVIKDKLAVFP